MMEQIVSRCSQFRRSAPVRRRAEGHQLPPQLCTRERHYGQNILVTRKGAVRAREGDMGIIPAAWERRSYIVRGKGNMESFMAAATAPDAPCPARKPSAASASKTISE